MGKSFDGLAGSVSVRRVKKKSVEARTRMMTTMTTAMFRFHDIFFTGPNPIHHKTA